MSEFLRKIQQAKSDAERRIREERQREWEVKQWAKIREQEKKDEARRQRREYDEKVASLEEILSSLGVNQMLSTIKREMKYEWMGGMKGYDGPVIEKTSYDKPGFSGSIWVFQSLRYKDIATSSHSRGGEGSNSYQVQTVIWNNLGVKSMIMYDRLQLVVSGMRDIELATVNIPQIQDPVEEALVRKAGELMARRTNRSGYWSK